MGTAAVRKWSYPQHQRARVVGWCGEGEEWEHCSSLWQALLLPCAGEGESLSQGRPLYPPAKVHLCLMELLAVALKI